MDEALALLARIVNRASRVTAKSAGTGTPVVEVPVALLEQVRDLLEGFRETGTAEIKHATNRVFN